MEQAENGARIVLGGCGCSHQVDRRWLETRGAAAILGSDCGRHGE